MRPKPNKVPHALVHVTWLDAESDTNWLDIDEVVYAGEESRHAQNESVGFLLKQDKHWVTIAAGVAWNGNWIYTNIQRIPLGMKPKIKVLQHG